MRRFEQRPTETPRRSASCSTARSRLREHRPRGAPSSTSRWSRRGTRDWVLDKVAVAEPAKGCRAPRADPDVVEWDGRQRLHDRQDGQGAEHLVAAFDDSCARPTWPTCIHELSPSAARRSPPRSTTSGSPTCSRSCPRTTRSRSSASSTTERAADVLEEMAPDDAADLLARAARPRQRSGCWQLMEPRGSRDGAPAARRTASETAGGLMTTEPVILPPDATVAEALAHVRNAGPHARAGRAWCYVVPRRRSRRRPASCLGIVHIQRLLREPPSTLVARSVDTDLDPLRAEAHPRGRWPATSPPTTSSPRRSSTTSGRLLGAVTVDDVLDHLLPEDWRDRTIEAGGERRWAEKTDAAAREAHREEVGRATRSRSRPPRPAAGRSARQLAAPACGRRRRSARFAERIARFMGTAPVPGLHDAVRRSSGSAGTSWRRPALRFDKYPFIFLTLMLCPAGVVRRPADPARPEPPGRPRPGDHTSRTARRTSGRTPTPSS